MVHILTFHFGTPAWLEIQKRHILKYTEGKPYKLWLGKYRLDLPNSFELPENWEVIDLDEIYPEENGVDHYQQMEWMYHNCVKNNMDNDDVIIIIDNDAFPCDNGWWMLPEALQSDDPNSPQVIHTSHAENIGIAQPPEYHVYPDLCFFATTKRVWEENNLGWGFFQPGQQNPGFGMKDRISEADLKLGLMKRTNRFNSHRVMFGVYGDCLYHQHCGSRALIGRPQDSGAGGSVNNRRMCYTAADLQQRMAIGNWFEQDFETECEDVVEVNTEIFDIIYGRLESDEKCTFVRRYFLGVN
tara:strand:- start:4206 stop:5102 length:897 start_codon:yes stop_codon:yes gene_type:complete